MTLLCRDQMLENLKSKCVRELLCVTRLMCVACQVCYNQNLLFMGGWGFVLIKPSWWPHTEKSFLGTNSVQCRVRLHFCNKRLSASL